jgi:phosphoglycolate phosphatase
LILEYFSTFDGVVVGDRKEDIDAGKRNNLTSVAAAYGYGTLDEFKEADIIINAITELLIHFN